YIEMHHEVDHLPVEKVLAYIIRRHESLRTIFTTVDDHPYQVIIEDTPVPLELIDLSMLGPAERTRARQRVYSDVAEVPFDLTRPLLFRSALVKLEPEHYQLMFNMHHIISDGWSLEILRQEFTQLYEAHLEGQELELPPLAVQYKDFAQWHNRQIQGPEGKISHRFWTQKLANGLPALKLPADWEKGKEPAGAGYRWCITKNTARQLKKLSADHQITLFTLMFSVYLLFLSRICNRKDIVCSVIAAGRDHPSLHHIMGFFVNSIIIQARVDE
ncbi:MAG: hypothetical protein GY940_46315, partial [bacterium]|nr:hypothetical protein [bacterium]